MGRHLKIYCLNDLRSFSNLWSKEAPLPVAGGDSIPQDLNLPQVPNLREVRNDTKYQHIWRTEHFLHIQCNPVRPTIHGRAHSLSPMGRL